MNTKRVVITGIGIWSCLGKNVEEVAQALREGRSGIGIDPERTTYGYQSALTGIVERPRLKGLLDRRLRNGLAEEGEYAFMAAASSATTLPPHRSSKRPTSCGRSTTRPCSAAATSSSR